MGFKFAPELVDYPVPFVNDEGGRSLYTVSTVSLGYENIVFRVFAVVVGDSFAACASVNMAHCWVELLEGEVGKDFANMAVISYGPQQMRRMLTQYGLPLEPELVLWVFYANDPYDAWHYEQFGVANVIEGKFWDDPIRTWLMQHSSTYLVLMYSWYNRRLYYNLLMSDDEAIASGYKLAWWQMATDPTTSAVLEGVNLTRVALSDARQQTLAKFKDASFVVVIIPTRDQVYATDPTLQSQLDALTENLVNFARQHDISVIDLTSPLKEKAKDEPFIYFKRDVHLNPRGNAVVAELLEKELAKLLAQ